MSGNAATDLLFVYGTLRRGGGNMFARRLEAESRYLGEARVRGQLYRVNEYPALIADEAGCEIRGEVLRLHDSGRTLAWLDAYEECDPAFPQPWEYVRQAISVEVSGDAALAWVYLYNRPTDALPRIESGDWMKRDGLAYDETMIPASGDSA